MITISLKRFVYFHTKLYFTLHCIERKHTVLQIVIKMFRNVISKNIKSFWNNISSDCVICALKISLAMSQYAVFPYTTKCYHHTTLHKNCTTSIWKCCLGFVASAICFIQTYRFVIIALNTTDVIEFWFTLIEIFSSTALSTLTLLHNLFPEKRKCQINELAQILNNNSAFCVKTVANSRAVKILVVFIGGLWILSVLSLVVFFSVQYVNRIDLFTNLNWCLICFCSEAIFIFFVNLLVLQVYLFLNCTHKIQAVLLRELLKRNIASNLNKLFDNKMRMELANVTERNLEKSLKLLRRFYMAVCANYRKLYIFDIVPIYCCFIMILICVINIYLFLIAFEEMFQSWYYIFMMTKHAIVFGAMFCNFYVFQTVQSMVSIFFYLYAHQ